MFETTLAFLLTLASAAAVVGITWPDLVTHYDLKVTEAYKKDPSLTFLNFAAPMTAWFATLVVAPPVWLRPAAVIGMAVGLTGIFLGGFWLTIVGVAVAAATWWPEKFDRFGVWNFARWEKARFIGIATVIFGLAWWVDSWIESSTLEVFVVLGAAALWYADQQGLVAKAVEKAKPWVAPIKDADLRK